MLKSISRDRFGGVNTTKMRRGRDHLRWLGLAVAFAALLNARIVHASPAVHCASGPGVATDEGPVCGQVSGDIQQFLAIPYAAPPVGNLRWEPPQAVAPWTTPRQATDFASACPQKFFPSGVQGGSEDCLYLNVFRPNPVDAGRLPVMVEIHGGGFYLGSGVYNAAPITSRGHVVLVTINYRLGILGFLAHTGFGGPPGNYGLLDQQAALRWVKRNIAAFGGNPENVTIYGSSAGGSSVCMQMISPLARGLFAKGIIESGHYADYESGSSCSQTLPTLAQAEASAAQFADVIGCGTATDVVACLRSKSVSDLFNAGSGPPLQFAIRPIVDGTVLREQPQAAFGDGRFNRVPVINGIGRDEGRTFLTLQKLPDGGASLTPADYEADIRAKFGAAANRVLAEYPLDRYPTVRIALGTVWSDSATDCPALFSNIRLSRWVPTYGYQMNEGNETNFYAPESLSEGSFHSAEAIYLNPSPQGFNANETVLSNQFIDEWTTFARTGNPTARGTPVWPRFHRHNQYVLSMIAGADTQITSDMWLNHHCGFWTGVLAHDDDDHDGDNHDRDDYEGHGTD